MLPMLATRGTRIPTGPQWLHEVKWDGMRALASVVAGRPVALTSRRGNDAAVSFPELQSLADLGDRGGELLLDGELVAFKGGLPSFPALAERMHVNRPARAAVLAGLHPVTFVAFDLLRLGGRDLTVEPLSQRRALLEALIDVAPGRQVSPAYPDGVALFDATRDQGLEGVVSKRLDSRYEAGVRSGDWLKFPHRLASSWVVGGWRFQTGSRVSLGAVLVGEPGPGGLTYRGRVGSGIGQRLGEVLKEVLHPLALPESPFADEVPAVDAAGAQWVEPLLVVDVEALGLTPQGRLRQPSLRGVRPDLTPDDLEG